MRHFESKNRKKIKKSSKFLVKNLAQFFFFFAFGEPEIICNFLKFKISHSAVAMAHDGDESIVVAILGVYPTGIYYFLPIITHDKVGENVGLCQDFTTVAKKLNSRKQTVNSAAASSCCAHHCSPFEKD